MSGIKVTVLVHDIASNTLGVATALAGVLAERFEVQVVGPEIAGGISEMYRGVFPYTVVSAPKLYRWPDFLWQVLPLAKAITGDVIIAVKAYADTVPVALWRKRKVGCKVVTYLDEWDAAPLHEANADRWGKGFLSNLHHPLDDHYFPVVERLIRRTDAVVSSSSFLQNRFGGVVIPFGADTDLFCPQAEKESVALRASLGLNGKKIIVFAGVVRPHKGMELLLNAVQVLGDPAVRVLVVGPVTDYLAELQSRPVNAPWLRCTGPQRKEMVARFLGVADLVVIPQDNTLLSQSQVPCKVFEAMAAGKPVIATAVSDLPEILEGCGLIVPPEHPSELANAIREVFSRPDAAMEKGAVARRKCLRQYSREIMSRQWTQCVERVVGRETGKIVGG